MIYSRPLQACAGQYGRNRHPNNEHKGYYIVLGVARQRDMRKLKTFSVGALKRRNEDRYKLKKK